MKGFNPPVVGLVFDLIATLGVPRTLIAGCTANCPPTKWQKTASQLPHRSSGQVSMAGFGQALADAPIICGPTDPNPQVFAADAVWQDFRFYADIPGAGIFKGRLNRSQVSRVHFSAVGPGGLFPAQLTNQLFVKLTSLDIPLLEYRNQIVLEMFAPATPAAPPDPGVTTFQVHPQDVFTLVSPLHGAPSEIVLSGGVQRFCVGEGIGLTRVLVEDLRMRFQVLNPFPEDITVAYFGHLPEVDPLALDSLDGVLPVPAGGSAEFDLDLGHLPLPVLSTLYVETIVLRPANVPGCRRLIFRLAQPQSVPATSPTGLAVLIFLLLFAALIALAGRKQRDT